MTSENRFREPTDAMDLRRTVTVASTTVSPKGN
jgi:hypothetical protein